MPVPALLHNRPERIPEGGRAAGRATCATATTTSSSPTATAAPTAASTSSGSSACAGEHCYDVFARDEVAAAARAEEPGTYFLTDFLARTFEHTVVRELGLDRHPDLRDAYFGGYRRVVWLAQRRTPAGRARGAAGGRAHRPAARVREVGDAGLEAELERLLAAPAGRSPLTARARA